MEEKKCEALISFSSNGMVPDIDSTDAGLEGRDEWRNSYFLLSRRFVLTVVLYINKKTSTLESLVFPTLMLTRSHTI